jgi:hypothetical protein
VRSGRRRKRQLRLAKARPSGCGNAHRRQSPESPALTDVLYAAAVETGQPRGAVNPASAWRDGRC